MRFGLAILVLAAALSAASAQEEDQTFRLNNQDLAVIGAALAERPYKDVRQLIDKLQAQINEHAAAAAKAKGADAPAEKK